MTIYILFATLVFFLSAIFMAAATLEPNNVPGTTSAISSPVGMVAAESAARRAAGEKLFQERGCIGCHRPDATGIGPALMRLFGRPRDGSDVAVP